MSVNNWSRVMAGALTVTAALLLAACTGPKDTPTTEPSTSPASTTPTTPRPTPTTDPDVAAAEAAILDAYRGYWATKVAILADPATEPDGTLEVYAVDTALTDVYSTVLDFRSDRIMMVGEPILSPTVTEIVTGPEGTATITDCVDVADWQPVFRDTLDSAAAPGQATSVSATATAYFYDGRWTIRTYIVDRETPC